MSCPWQFDCDMAARYSRFGAAPIMPLAYLRYLTQPYMTIGRIR